MAKLEQCGVLWVNQDKNGNDYMIGTVGGKKVIIFSNRNKKESKHPDWIVYPQQPRTELPPKEDEDSEIPF